MKARFDRRQYDHGQFEDSTRELYCELCGVTVATRDVMESHKQVQYTVHTNQTKQSRRGVISEIATADINQTSKS